MNETSKKDPRIAKVLGNKIVREVIEEAIGNWTRNYEVMDPTMLEALQSYAAAVATKIFDAQLPHPNFAPDWKVALSNKVYEALDLEEFLAANIPIVVEQLRAKHGDKTQELTDGLWRYSLSKIAHNAGCVAYMVSVGLEPRLLLLTREESREELLKLAARSSGEVMVIDPSELFKKKNKRP